MADDSSKGNFGVSSKFIVWDFPSSEISIDILIEFKQPLVD